jgi:formylglycine-generating enzyme required for sulfatase activity
MERSGKLREGAHYAATYTRWTDIQTFCEKLSDKENATYRLASEAEWEFACRAGTTTQFSLGDDPTKLSNYAWWGGILGDGSAANEQFAHEVGLKLANPFGLHDMHGNVWEWCVDSYATEVPGGTDPFRLEGGLVGVCRGGGWNSYSFRARSAFRFRIVYHHAFLPLGSPRRPLKGFYSLHSQFTQAKCSASRLLNQLV